MENAMILHIIFNKKEGIYFPNADFYEVTRSRQHMV
jgi:hypothetical protein